MATTLEYIVERLTNLGIKVASLPSLEEAVECWVMLPHHNYLGNIKIYALGGKIKIKVVNKPEDCSDIKAETANDVLDILHFYRKYVSGSFKVKLTVKSVQKDEKKVVSYIEELNKLIDKEFDTPF
jgi:hypothetical protein